MNDLDERLKTICEKVARRFYCKYDSSEDWEDVFQDAIVVALQKNVEPPTSDSERRLAYAKIRRGLIDGLRARTHGRSLLKNGNAPPFLMNAADARPGGEYSESVVESAVAQKSLNDYETRRREESRDVFSYDERRKDGTLVRRRVSERTLKNALTRSLCACTKLQREIVRRKIQGITAPNVFNDRAFSTFTVWTYMARFRNRFREELNKAES